MNIATLFNAMPGALAQGLIWAIMAIGVYLAFAGQDLGGHLTGSNAQIIVADGQGSNATAAHDAFLACNDRHTGESKVEEMPIEYAPEFTKEYNPTIAEALGITIPDDYVAYEG